MENKIPIKLGMALPAEDGTLVPAWAMPAYIGVARQTLARWRVQGNGPKYVKVGRLVFYRAGDVRAWLAQQVRWNTCTVRLSTNEKANANSGLSEKEVVNG